jgi:hypothetical protein
MLRFSLSSHLAPSIRAPQIANADSNLDNDGARLQIVIDGDGRYTGFGMMSLGRMALCVIGIIALPCARLRLAWLC